MSNAYVYVNLSVVEEVLRLERPGQKVTVDAPVRATVFMNAQTRIPGCEFVNCTRDVYAGGRFNATADTVNYYEFVRLNSVEELIEKIEALPSEDGAVLSIGVTPPERPVPESVTEPEKNENEEELKTQDQNEKKEE
ncbi:MAG: hypothetical protein EOP84_36345 [Verrucomicrobiaceae bacterium]|nr:MAG: hypothetical protein EOP84_36345 [Verrucomicrobiaceae bacterium]